MRLKAIDFVNQTLILGASLLITLLPLLILLSALASQRIDDDLALRLGLDHRAAAILTHLFAAAPAAFTGATALGLLIGWPECLRLRARCIRSTRRPSGKTTSPKGLCVGTWYGRSSCAPSWGSKSVLGGQARSVAARGGLVEIVTCVILGSFFWWTMHFLLAGRVRWRELLPSAIATGIFFAGLGLFSQLYFSSTIISDSKTYGSIGAVFSILTRLTAVSAVILLGAVAGALWQGIST